MKNLKKINLCVSFAIMPKIVQMQLVVPDP